MSTDPKAPPLSDVSAAEFTPTPGQLQKAPKPERDLVSRVFIGREGIRSGWRFLLYLIMFMMARSLGHGPIPRSVGQLFIRECLLLSMAAFPALVMGRIEKRNFSVYGLSKAGAFGRMFWGGILWGIVAVTALMVLMRAAGVFYFGAIELHGIQIVKFAAIYGAIFVMVGLAEEFLFRGYSLFTLAQGAGFWPAAVLLSATFGALHLRNSGEGPAGGLFAAFIGLFLCLTLRRTGSLWFAVGFHAAWDWSETFLYSVPNSGQTWPGQLLRSSFQGPAWLTGGTIGPEGSVLAFVVVTAVWVIFERLHPQANYPSPANHRP